MDNNVNEPKKQTFKVKALALAVATTVATTVVGFTDVNNILYKTDVLNLPEHAPYDGTTYPIKKIPNWTHIAGEKRDLPYSQLEASDLVDVPYYDASQLKVSTDTLKWGNPVDDVIRNAKITYSTPYLGNYRLDGVENGGSHPAVDIKVPEGTPVYAIANGVVSKVSDQSSGFGHHIVIQHNNFPSFEDPGKKMILHSSYSHLSTNLVSVGDVVTKGQQIALSGETGTATTPHVHFQIDNDEAPYHPFWPFTWQEASAAGLDFFSAVNAGLGVENAKLTTVNPVMYVQKYMNGMEANVAVGSDAGGSTSADNSGVDAVSYVTEDTGEAVAGENPSTGNSSGVSVEGTVSETPVVAESPSTGETAVVENVPATEIPAAEVPADTTEKPLFTDINSESKYFEAVKYLSEKGIIAGYDDGSFKPDQPVNRVEALKFILESISAAVESGNLPFSDISKDAWYSGYLYTAYKREIINGHPDGTFKPEDTVNKAEFFKILFNGLSVDIDPLVTTAPYEDVATNDWFASYISYAKELKILDPDLKKIEPSRGMTRGEVADAMYRLMNLVK